jgi:hypothetical protein
LKKIFITGCAKSGTTLLKDMFRSFDSTFVIESEIGVNSFSKLTQKKVGEFECVVGKRTWDSIYSCGRLRKTDIESQYYQLQKAEIIVINVIRDGRNVVASLLNDWGWYNPFEWMECIRQTKDNGGIITLTVRFEDLILRPDEVQNEIIVATGLNANHSFSDYPSFIETTEEREKNYTFRPLDRSRVKPDVGTYLIRPNDVEHFNEILKGLGYN